MQLQKLSLINFRAFKQANFEFKPGMNLIVGINGVGKSSVLDAIRVMFSQIIPKISQSKSKRISFQQGDVYKGETYFEISMDFITLVTPMSMNGKFEQRLKSSYKPNNKRIFDELKRSDSQPLVAYYSPSRSLSDLKETGNTKDIEDRREFAFLDSLADRELRLQEFIDWFRVQDAQGQEDGDKIIYRKNTKLFTDALHVFMEKYTDIRVEEEILPEKLDKDNNIVKQKPKAELLLNKDGSTINAKQLSDGERGILSLVLDLSRRLAYANPALGNPLEGKALVLIDELDLHLHPGWQRDSVKKLKATFPNCQFIATTHSPQIVGEVPPENIIILEDGKPPKTPNQSYGMDSNWILDVLMGTQDRNSTILGKLTVIETLIDERNFSTAQKNIADLRLETGDFPELAKLETRIHRIQTLGK